MKTCSKFALIFFSFSFSFSEKLNGDQDIDFFSEFLHYVFFFFFVVFSLRIIDALFDIFAKTLDNCEPTLIHVYCLINL